MSYTSRVLPRQKGCGKERDNFYDVSNFERQDTINEYGISIDDKGNMTRQYASTIRLRKQRVNPSPPKDEYAKWKPFHKSSTAPDASKSQFKDGEDTSDEEDEDIGDVKAGAAAGTGKRKRYACSDDPNGVWRPYAIELLHELYRFDGLGDSLSTPCCSTCGALYQTTPKGSKTTVRLFRCQDCSPLLECMDCCLDRHQSMPLHNIKEWLTTHFERTSLRALGLVYQMGHAGLPCLAPEEKCRRMVVLDCNGVHEVSFRYCECAVTFQTNHIQQLMRAGWYPATITDPRTCATYKVLDYYRELNVRANVNVDDFIDTLLGLTNAIETRKIPYRRKTFSRMVRQWVLLHHLKRSGVGISLRSLDDIPEGSLAVLCWACPQLNMNVELDEWEKVDPKDFYLYMPVVALDANFRLKNRLRPNEQPDPELAPGSAYFVNPAAYKEHLKNYVSETDISTCVAFAALLEKDTKLTTGLKTSGVAGCACARHELVLPLGLGDLQKGERYSNMDYVFFSAIKGFRLLPHLGASYDIGCQWKRNVWDRMDQLPEELHVDRNQTTLTFGLPTWHAAAHELSCRSANALTYQEGLARTDGEGIERIWSLLNPVSYATKGMAEGLRHDSIDDRVDHLNFKKDIGLGEILARRLLIALEERDKQIENFRFNDGKLDPTVRAQWRKVIDDWKSNKELPSPYLLTKESLGPSEEEIRAELKAEEDAEKKKSRTTIHGTSIAALLVAGLDLEDMQIRIRRDVKAASTTHQRAQVEEQRQNFFDKLKKFRTLQHIYIPGALRAIQHEDSTRPPNGPSDNAENVKLWLPSDFNADQRVTACVAAIADQEARLRTARCSDALVSIRHYLNAKKHLLGFRNANVTGQNESTRARTVINNVGAKIDTEADKYWCSRQALLSLKNIADIDEYPELKPEDVAFDVVDDPDLLALVRLGDAGSKAKKHHRGDHVSSGKKVPSWIWMGAGGLTEEEGIAVNESARVEWSKALARRDRWVEEVKRLREEMRRVLRFLDWRVSWWKDSMPAIDEAMLHLPATAIAAGIRAHAFQQVAYLEQVQAKFRRLWGHEPAVISLIG